jgi:TRAP-type C4-dicarboxylate transport system permease large subunit
VERFPAIGGQLVLFLGAGLLAAGINSALSVLDFGGGHGLPLFIHFGWLEASLTLLLIFLVVIGGIYGGFFTPTEAAAIGTVATAFVAWRSGGLRGKGFLQCMYGTAAATGMIFLILLGADVLNVFLALTQLNVELAKWVIGLDLSPLLVMFLIIFIYLVLGCIMDSLSMILLTIPIFFPIIMGLDFWGLDPESKAIWFGMIVLMVVEIGASPPTNTAGW